MPVRLVMERWAEAEPSGSSEPMRRFRVLERVGARVVERTVVLYREDWGVPDKMTLWDHDLDDGSSLIFFVREGRSFDIMFGRNGTAESYGSLPVEAEWDDFGPIGGTCALFKISVPGPLFFSRGQREHAYPVLEQLTVPDDPPEWGQLRYVRERGRDVYSSGDGLDSAYWWRLTVYDLRPSELASVVRVKRSFWRREPQIISLRLDNGRRIFAYPHHIEPGDDGSVLPRKGEHVLVGFDESFSKVARVWLTNRTADGKKL